MEPRKPGVLQPYQVQSSSPRRVADLLLNCPLPCELIFLSYKYFSLVENLLDDTPISNSTQLQLKTILKNINDYRYN